MKKPRPIPKPARAPRPDRSRTSARPLIEADPAQAEWQMRVLRELAEIGMVQVRALEKETRRLVVAPARPLDEIALSYERLARCVRWAVGFEAKIGGGVRLDELDEFREIGEQSFGEIVAGICRDLGLDPNDAKWHYRAPESTARGTATPVVIDLASWKPGGTC